MLYAHRHMCSAFYQAMRGFKLENKVNEPNEDFNDEELRYQHRFRVFEGFTTPPLCFYKQFKEKDNQFINTVSLDKIYFNSQQHFEQAKNSYEELGDWNSVRLVLHFISTFLHLQTTLFIKSSIFAKVAKTNFIVMRLLASGLKKIQVRLTRDEKMKKNNLYEFLVLEY